MLVDNVEPLSEAQWLAGRWSESFVDQLAGAACACEGVVGKVHGAAGSDARPVSYQVATAVVTRGSLILS